jgi:hypothetical protein
MKRSYLAITFVSLIFLGTLAYRLSLSSGAPQTSHRNLATQLDGEGDGNDEGFTVELAATPATPAISTQQNKALIDYSEFFKSFVLSKIPATILDRINIKKLLIVLNSECEFDGKFDPQFNPAPHTIVVQLHPRMLKAGQFENIITHEFFHGIHYLINPDEPRWIREGLAQYFESWIHQKFNPGFIQATLTQPSSAIDADYSLDVIEPQKYGDSLLFFKYLIEHLATLSLSQKSSKSSQESTITLPITPLTQSDVFWKLALGNSPHKGISSINQLLQPYQFTFNSFLPYYWIAKITNQRNSAYSQQSQITYLSQLIPTQLYLVPTLQKQIEFQQQENSELVIKKIKAISPHQPFFIASTQFLSLLKKDTAGELRRYFHFVMIPLNAKIINFLIDFDQTKDSESHALTLLWKK